MHSRFACSGPAPPKATIVSSRGSLPRRTVTSLSALIIVAFAISMIPYAASSGPSPSGSAHLSRMPAAAASTSSAISPPRK